MQLFKNVWMAMSLVQVVEDPPTKFKAELEPKNYYCQKKKIKKNLNYFLENTRRIGVHPL
jgi:hypothetical protein